MATLLKRYTREAWRINRMFTTKPPKVYSPLEGNTMRTDPLRVKCGIYKGDALSALLACIRLNHKELPVRVAKIPVQASKRYQPPPFHR